MICRTHKPPDRRGKILLINAVDEVTRERAQSFLEEEHIQKIVQAYQSFAENDSFSRIIDTVEVVSNGSSLNIPLYVRPKNGKDPAQNESPNLEQAILEWQSSSRSLRQAMDDLIGMLRSNQNNHPKD